MQADRRRKAAEQIDALMLEGLNSGTPIPIPKQFWEAKKRQLTERLGKFPGTPSSGVPRIRALLVIRITKSLSAVWGRPNGSWAKTLGFSQARRKSGPT
jgi:uncharacterized protein YoaH (UPF0181 family)